MYISYIHIIYMRARGLLQFRACAYTYYTDNTYMYALDKYAYIIYIYIHTYISHIYTCMRDIYKKRHTKKKTYMHTPERNGLLKFRTCNHTVSYDVGVF